MSFLAQLELLYRRMQEAGASKLEFQIGPQEKLRLIRKSDKPLSVDNDLVSSQGSQSVSPTFDVGHKVTAPLSGVFYRAASPSSPVFVEEGASVNRGDVLCIIEAMKVMNEVKAPRPGKILKIYGANGKHIKKGDTIFILED